MAEPSNSNSNGSNSSNSNNNSNSKPRKMTTPKEEQLQNKGREKLESVVDNHFFRDNEARILPTFDVSELSVGPRLGVGGFCVVCEVSAIQLRDEFDPPPDAEDDGNTADDADAGGARADNHGGAEDAAAERRKESAAAETPGPNQPRVGPAEASGGSFEPQESSGDASAADQHEFHYDLSPRAARYFMAEHCLRAGEQGGKSSRKDARYAVKKLRRDLTERDRARGILDLAIEAKFLAVISHPNIIKMRGTANAASADPLGPDYFLILDRLFGTLEDKMYDWCEDYKKYGGRCCGMWGVDRVSMNDLLLDRLTVAYDIATAFRYLHGQNIVYRDIKPENFGFDVRGDIKVFDFGLAKVLRRKDKLKDGLYKLTGLTGSRRYMAPEVVRCEPYNLTADSFSFGILLWQILALQVPFENLTPADHKELVCDKGFRPSVSMSWPVFTRNVLKECWSESIHDRPDFVRISNVIRGEMKDIADTARGSIHNRTAHMMNRSQRSHRSMMRDLPAETTFKASAHSDS